MAYICKFRWKRRLSILGVAVMLGGCSVDMTNPLKTPAEAALDKSRCMQLAEDDSLTRANRPRTDYALNSAKTPKAGNFGESPMQMADRMAVRKDYNSSYIGCLEARGYSQTKK